MDFPFSSPLEMQRAPASQLNPFQNKRSDDSRGLTNVRKNQQRVCFNLELDLQVSDTFCGEEGLNPILAANAFLLAHQEGEAERVLGASGRGSHGMEDWTRSSTVTQPRPKVSYEISPEDFSWRCAFPSFHLSFHQSIFLSVHLSICPSIYLSKSSAASSHGLPGLSARSQKDGPAHGGHEGHVMQGPAL